MTGLATKWVAIIAGGIVLLALVASIGFYLGSKRKPDSLKDRVSYSIGSQFGKSLTSQNLDLDSRMVARGLVDSIDGEKNPLTDAEMEAAMVKLNDQRRKDMVETAAKNKSDAEVFLASNGIAEGVKTLPNGLQIKVLSEGKGAQPKPGDIVVVNYRGTLADGKEFDQSYKRGVPAEFPVKGVVPGWGQGLMQMHKGEKAIIFVPPELAYGDRPRQNIPSNAVLIFETELLDIKAAPAPTPPTKK